MGIAYRCDTTSGLTVEVWHGEITDDQPREHIARLASDPDWAASRLLVTDLSTISPDSRPSADRIAEVGATFLQHLACRVADVKWAVIADHTFEEACNFGSHIKSEVRRMIVFNSVPTACIWMGLDPSDVQIVVDNLRQGLAR